MRLILGTMTFGPQVDLETSRMMVSRFLDHGNTEIDAAYVYNGGDSERFLGNILTESLIDSAQVATKVNPRVTGRLDRDAITSQLNESLERVKRDSVDILYLHFPDPSTPINETLEVCAELYREGKFKRFGLSNFSAWEVVNIWHLCHKSGWPVPEIYQGLYNGLSRAVERELIPALRHLGIRFYAYNPLAGGILAGKYQDFSKEPISGRFTHRPNYRSRYWKKPFFDALSILNDTCNTLGISLVESAYRWLAFHSSLDSDLGDGLIIGASNACQLEQNLGILVQGPLPETIAKAYDQAWCAAKSECPDYFRTSV
ncbi:aldo/keto reductase [Pelagicoccus sp. SDUM812002]|uniref:aldo/keto reductase family protein n=1 Tax=Pelagicoccus sp. SDUM812002 TaxID=3041266 RepID=UPI00280D6FAC|nr:aldo/keto reductase [Pelagicoccus sp. SDUM812002]MDQ8186284.1 aldo/keto reductase [Pelagicoccus sp. SDUM812002]